LLLAGIGRAQQLSKEDQDREKKFQEQAAAAKADSAKKYGWSYSMNTGANLTQVSFKDWVQGGENALAYTAFLNGGAALSSECFGWSNSYNLAIGQTRLGDEGIRKTDDEIYFESLLIYKMGVYVNPYASVTMRTQFAKGFKYDNTGIATPVSKFFDPGYLTQSVGVAYQPIQEVKTRFGFAVREILTSSFNAYADDPNTPEVEKSRVDGGFEWVTEAAWGFAENLTLASRLEIFTPATDVHRTLARSDNMITAKVNKYITASLGVQLVNDVTVSPRTQIKQVLAMGFVYAIL